MIKRITISLPEELYDRLQAFKDDINVSSVCQKAITKIVERKEDFRKRIKESHEMKSILERLSTQKHESQGIVFELGEKDGEGWAKIAHLDELIDKAEEIPSDYNDGVLGPEFVEDPYIFVYLQEKYRINSDMNRFLQTYLEEVIPEVIIYEHNHIQIEWAYQRGWWTGILNFWNEIKDKI